MYQHKSISLADQIFEKLEKDILIGKYSFGEVLTETKLSEELGVSRTPVREALRRLAQEKLIKETQKGTIVLGIDRGINQGSSRYCCRSGVLWYPQGFFKYQR